MNKQDLAEMQREDPEFLTEAKRVLGMSVVPSMAIPSGYVQDTKTGVIYKLDTWKRLVEQGLKKAQDGSS